MFFFRLNEISDMFEEIGSLGSLKQLLQAFEKIIEVKRRLAKNSTLRRMLVKPNFM